MSSNRTPDDKTRACEAVGTADETWILLPERDEDHFVSVDSSAEVETNLPQLACHCIHHAHLCECVHRDKAHHCSFTDCYGDVDGEKFAPIAWQSHRCNASETIKSLVEVIVAITIPSTTEPRFKSPESARGAVDHKNVIISIVFQLSMLTRSHSSSSIALQNVVRLLAAQLCDSAHEIALLRSRLRDQNRFV